MSLKRGLILLLLAALPAGAQQRHVHEGGLHVFPGKPCVVNVGPGPIATMLETQCPSTNRPLASSSTGANAPTALQLLGPYGGNTSSTTATAGTGGPFDITAGPGGDATATSGTATGGVGGAFTVSGGPGGGNTPGSSGANGTGGALNITGGPPGSGASTPGNYGDAALRGRFVDVQGWLTLDSDSGGSSHSGGTTITADNQAVDVNSVGLPGLESNIFLLSSDNTTASNRTFTIPNPLRAGRLLVLAWVGNTSRGELLNGSNVKLSARWPDGTAPDGNTLVLIGLNTTTWMEVSRSTPAVSAADAIMVNNAHIDATTLQQEYKDLRPVFCNGAVATTEWDLPAALAPVPTCVAGTNIIRGMLPFPDAGGAFSAQRTIYLPTGWDSEGVTIQTNTRVNGQGNHYAGLNFDLIWSTASVVGNVRWNVAFVCANTNATATDDTAFPAYALSVAENGGNVITPVPGVANYLTHSAINIPMAGSCRASPTDPTFLHIKIVRDGADGSDTAGATVNLQGVMLTYYAPFTQPYKPN